ncbi:MAG: nuclear transport factor 2 family protein [Gaiellaceae bacterium]
MVVSSAEAVAAEFVSALAGQDWERLEACFAPDARFFAAVPSANPLRERIGAHDAASQLAAWFGDADPLELVESQVEPVAGKIRVSYRLRSFEEGAWHLVEQQAFCEVGSDGIQLMLLACSGFQRLDPTP